MNLIFDTIMNAWTGSRRTKRDAKGWIKASGSCCIHNGETQDTRGRAGFIVDGERISYNCFNCSFSTGWSPGWHLGFKMRKLMSWIGMDETEIKRMVFEAMRIKDEVGEEYIPEPEIKIEFKPRELPEKAQTIEKWLMWDAMKSDTDDYDSLPKDLEDVIVYCDGRGMNSEQINKMYWTPDTEMKMNRRVIIPFTYDNKIIGYTGRSIDKVKMLKYFNQYEPNYVYGIDDQMDDAKMVIVMEGPLDAMVINGVATLGNDISETQAEIIERLHREVIVVPDKGSAGQKLIDYALEYGWSVSFPEWAGGFKNDITDVNEAVQVFGKIFTLRKIIKHKESSPLKIELMRKKYI